MGRSNTKMPLELIKSDKSRRVTFGKRKKGLIKKTSELTRLCDVQCGLIIFDEKKPHDQQTYPHDHRQLKEVINRFVSKSAKVRKVENLADYFGKQITQVNKDTGKLRHKNNEARFPSCNARLDDLSLDGLLDLSKRLDRKIEDVHQCFANRNAINDNGHHAILPQMDLFSSNYKVEYNNQTVGVNQYPSNNYGSMMYANDRVLQEEQADLQMFQNNLLNYDHHYDNGMTSWQNYNIEGAPSTTLNGSNYDGSFSSIMFEDRVQYGNINSDDLMTPFNHVPLQTVYPMSTSFLCGNANPFWNLEG